ncbi:MAG: hypothetical protein R3F49_16510 [Planctomycetota bacterium]
MLEVSNTLPVLSAVCALLACPPAVAQADCSDLVLRPSASVPGDAYGYDFNGHVVALDASRALVGAPHDALSVSSGGAAYLFEEAAGQWSSGERLAPLAPRALERFGTSVAIEGDRAVVGAPGPPSAAGLAGRVLVFERSAAGWREVAELTPQDGVPDDRFGLSVALAGDRIVVGAPNAGLGSDLHRGAAYVFARGGSGWAQVARLAQETPESYDAFGTAVALAGGRAVVRCPEDRHTPSERRGAAYVFEDIGGAWARTARLTGDAPHTTLGRAVALSGDTIVAGAPFGTVGFGGPYPGGAYVWELIGGAWIRAAYLHPTPGNDRFGDAVALDGDDLVVAAPTALAAPFGGGRVHLYRRGANGWDEVSERTAYDADHFGNSLAMANGRLLAADQAYLGASTSGRAHLIPFAGFEVEPFCFCTASGCHNSDATAGCANGTGAGCRLTACGTTSVSRDDLVLTAENAGPNTFGMYFMGRDATAPVFFGNGRRCIDDPVQLLRFPPRPAGSAGSVHEGPGIAAFTEAAFPAFGHAMVGQRWNFQLWYRDGGACGTGYNVSNALGVTFTP